MEEFIKKLTEGIDLNEREAKKAMRIIMSGKATQAQVGAFLTALKIKGETSQEIASFAVVMRKFAKKINPKVNGTLVDVCGTGSDKLNTFNISTTAMFIVAAGGIPIAKHGNRRVTSKCGSADVLEGLGVNLNLTSAKIKEGIEKRGIGFMFAPLHHSAMKHVMGVRRELGARTVFNIMGPLTNPANAKGQLMGVYSPDLTEKLARVFKLLGLKRAMVVYGEPGIDEISTLGKTKISELKEDEIKTYFIKPEDFGLKIFPEKDILGGGNSVEENVKILRNILRGEDKSAKRDITLLNAAAGIVVGGKASDLQEGFEIAKEVLDSGKAYEKLVQFIEFSREREKKNEI